MKNTRPHLLFVGEAVSLAHVTRPLVLAQALDTDDYTISFACGQRYRTLVDQAGFRFHSLPTLAPELFLQRLDNGAPLYDRSTLAHYVEAESALFRELQPDLIVGDFRVSLSISAERAGIPYVNLCNAHWSPYSTQHFPTPELPISRALGATAAGWIIRATEPLAFAYHARAYNQVRRVHGLKPVSGLREMYTRGTWTLYLDLPTLAPTETLPPHHRYLGPVVWSPHAPLPPFSFKDSSLPLLYITVGSSGDTRVLDAIIDAAKRLPLNAVLATAGRIKLDNLPANVFAADYLPAQEILPHAAACLFNGGAATGYQALSAGVPVLGFPSNADQFFFMESAERAGAGLLIRPSHASPALVAAKLDLLLNQSSFRQRARTLQQDIAAAPAAAAFQRFVRHWADSLPSGTMDVPALAEVSLA